jgi:hypothetical protein
MQIHETDPWSGYYRLAQSKDGPLEPLAIFRHQDVLYVNWGSISWEGAEARIDRIWPYAIGKPVPYAWYRAKIAGAEWPDIHQLAAQEESAAAEATAAIVPGPGHNSGASLTEVQLLAAEVDEARRGVKQYAKITNDDQRAQSQTLRSELLKLSGEADKRRKALLLPHETKVNEINADWMPLVKAAKESAAAIRFAQETWGTEKLRQQRAEQQRLDDERRQREEEQIALAAAAQAAVDRGETPPEPPVILAHAEETRLAPETSFKGGTGRAAHERAVEVITEVTDWKALFLYFVADQACRDFILKRASAILKSTGEIPPGVNTDVAAKVA